MKRLLCLFLCLLVLPCEGARWRVWSNVAASTYLLSDDMEYANNAAATAASWNLGGTPVFGYATAPAPLVGTKSVNIPSSADAADKSFTGTSDVWAFVAINTSVLSSSGPYAIVLRDSGLNNLCTVQLDAGFFTLRVGTSNISGGTVAINTTYYFWVHYTKGTGINAVGEVYYSTTTTKPGSPTISLSNGQSTADASNILLYAGQTGVAIYDYLRISASVIGSAPP